MKYYQETLKKKIKELEEKKYCENISKYELLRICKKYFKEPFLEIIKSQYNVRNVSPKGMRYTTQFKQFALGLYFLSPAAYKGMKNIMQLPSKSTLLNITKQWPIRCGYNDFIFKTMQLQTKNLLPHEKICTLCMDEMSIKTFLFYMRAKDEIIGFEHIHDYKSLNLASNVLVLMVRGLHAKWKQPIAYFFLADTCPTECLHKIVYFYIEKLFSIELDVTVLVSDQGPNFYKFSKELGISEAKPYFIVNNKRIFYLFDVPHLLKSTRNNFFKYNFNFDGGVIAKDYLTEIYEKDKHQRFRLLPKLTDEHINPNNFQKMKVKLASQIFSATVAATINTYVSLNHLSEEAMCTATFISLMDNLFDVFNSLTFKSNKILNRPFTDTPEQQQILQSALNFFKNVRIRNSKGKDVTNTVKFIKGWIISINAFLYLWESQKQVGIEHITTRRLNQDCLENFFSKIRLQGGESKNPTPIQFSRAFKKLFCLNSINIHAEGGNCIEDFDEALVNITRVDIASHKDLVEFERKIDEPLVKDTDYINIDLTEANAHVYICGYYLKKCLYIHACSICFEYAKSNTNLTDEVLFTHFKAYSTDSTFGSLCVAPESFIEAINALNNKFDEHFNEFAILPNCGLKIKNKLESVEIQHPCKDFPKDYLLNLFIRLRIYAKLKFINRDIKNNKAKCKKLDILKHY